MAGPCTIALGGNIWDNFSSQSYKDLPSAGEITWYQPQTGKPGATRKSLQASPDERFEIAAILRFGKLHLFAEVQNLERAGFELADLRPRICLGRPVLVLIRRDDRIVRAGLGDEPGDHRRELLADYLGVRVLFQLVELRDYRCQPRLSPKLPRADRLVNVQHLRGRHSLDRESVHREEHRFARMRLPEVVRRAPPIVLKLDAAPD